MPTKCPFCGNAVIEDKLPWGYVYCRNGHVLTVAPLYAIDPAVIVTAAGRLATQAIADGRAIDVKAVAAWRARR